MALKFRWRTWRETVAVMVRLTDSDLSRRDVIRLARAAAPRRRGARITRIDILGKDTEGTETVFIAAVRFCPSR